jgi:hypothetical protein
MTSMSGEGIGDLRTFNYSTRSLAPADWMHEFKVGALGSPPCHLKKVRLLI